MTKTNLPAKKEEWFFESYIQGSVMEFGPLEVMKLRCLNSLDAMIHSLFT